MAIPLQGGGVPFRVINEEDGRLYHVRIAASAAGCLRASMAASERWVSDPEPLESYAAKATSDVLGWDAPEPRAELIIDQFTHEAMPSEAVDPDRAEPPALLVGRARALSLSTTTPTKELLQKTLWPIFRDEHEQKTFYLCGVAAGAYRRDQPLWPRVGDATNEQAEEWWRLLQASYAYQQLSQKYPILLQGPPDEETSRRLLAFKNAQEQLRQLNARGSRGPRIPV
jgi:hypothetical protein